MNRICGIYKITSPSDRVYIGQSVNCKSRERQYRRCDCKGQRVLYNSISKHGWDSHKFQIIHECDKTQLGELEKYYAVLYNSYSKEAGMNIRECGGTIKEVSEETRRLLSKGMSGKCLSEETKIKMSNSHRIKVFSKTHKSNLSKSKKGIKNGMFGKVNTPEMKRVNSEKNSRGNNAFAKLVLNTETGIYYGCAKDAWESFRRQSFEYFKFKLQGKNHFNNTSFMYV